MPTEKLHIEPLHVFLAGQAYCDRHRLRSQPSFYISGVENILLINAPQSIIGVQSSKQWPD